MPLTNNNLFSDNHFNLLQHEKALTEIAIHIELGLRTDLNRVFALFLGRKN